jgi:hypothetical protein
MATYEEIAPMISTAGITLTQIDNYIANIEEPTQPPEPTPPTAQQCKNVADAYFGRIDKFGGIRNVAWGNSLTIEQVKTIIAEIKAVVAWRAENP